MSAVKRGQLRVLCAVVGADQQPVSLPASQTLSDQAVQSAQLTGNQGSLIEFLLLTSLFFSLPLSRVEQVSARFIFFSPCQLSEHRLYRSAHASTRGPTKDFSSKHSFVLQHAVYDRRVWIFYSTFFVFCGSP